MSLYLEEKDRHILTQQIYTFYVPDLRHLGYGSEQETDIPAFVKQNWKNERYYEGSRY